MGFLDKLKAGAGEAAELAGQAAGEVKEAAARTASRAKQEAKELQLRRELGEAYDELGKAAYELWETGQVESPHLESRARRVKTLLEELDALAAQGDESAEDAEGPSKPKDA